MSLRWVETHYSNAPKNKRPMYWLVMSKKQLQALQNWLKAFTSVDDELLFDAGRMLPKLAGARTYSQATGGFAAMDSLDEACQILAGKSGTRIIGCRRDIVSLGLWSSRS